MGKWSGTIWAKNLKAKALCAGMTDFDRFKLMVAKYKRSASITAVLKEANL